MKWKFNKTYVYYVPELDAVYTSEFLKDDKHDFGFKTVRHYPEYIDNGGPKDVYFNPDVLLLINHLTCKVKVYETVLVGTL